MRQNYELAEWLVAAWKLANPSERMPTSHGVLDRALKSVVEDGHVPLWVRENLTFVDTRVGLRCLELPVILDCAQESYLTSEPNYTYVTTAIKIDEVGAERLLEDLGVDPQDAHQCGQLLKRAIEDIVQVDSARPDLIEAA